MTEPEIKLLDRVADHRLRGLVGYGPDEVAEFEAHADPGVTAKSLRREIGRLERTIRALEARERYLTSVLCGYCSGSGTLEDYDIHGSYSVQCWCSGKGYHPKSIADIQKHYRDERDDHGLC